MLPGFKSGFGRGRKFAKECSLGMATKPEFNGEKAIAQESETQVKNGSIRELFHWIADLGKQIPPEELAALPTDASQHTEHYLYGHPKVQ